MFNYSNPSVRRWVKKSEAGTLVVNNVGATYGGVVGKSILLIGLTILSAVITMLATWYGLFKFVETLEINQTAVIAFIVGLIVAIVLMLVCVIAVSISPKTAKVFGPIYSMIQGAFLGFIAAFLNIILPFVTLAAMLGTALVFVVCVLMYKVIGVRIRNNFLRVMAISLICYVLIELIVLPIMLFTDIGEMATVMIWVQAITSFLCIIFASVTIIYDLQNIDYVVQSGADKSYEWPVAFSLITSLIYLYMQILQLLIRILVLFASSKKK